MKWTLQAGLSTTLRPRQSWSREAIAELLGEKKQNGVTKVPRHSRLSKAAVQVMNGRSYSPSYPSSLALDKSALDFDSTPFLR